jgi:hypothetical protein
VRRHIHPLPPRAFPLRGGGRKFSRLAPAVILLAALALGGCGKVGAPVPPSPDGWPHQYPKAEPLPETGATEPAPQPSSPPGQIPYSTSPYSGTLQ